MARKPHLRICASDFGDAIVAIDNEYDRIHFCDAEIVLRTLNDTPFDFLSLVAFCDDFVCFGSSSAGIAAYCWRTGALRWQRPDITEFKAIRSDGSRLLITADGWFAFVDAADGTTTHSHEYQHFDDAWFNSDCFWSVLRTSRGGFSVSQFTNSRFEPICDIDKPAITAAIGRDYSWVSEMGGPIHQLDHADFKVTSIPNRPNEHAIKLGCIDDGSFVATLYNFNTGEFTISCSGEASRCIGPLAFEPLIQPLRGSFIAADGAEYSMADGRRIGDLPSIKSIWNALGEV